MSRLAHDTLAAVVAAIAIVITASAPAYAANAGMPLYAGTVGSADGLLDPDAFWLTVDPATRLPIHLGVTEIAGCLESSGPLSVTVDARRSPTGDRSALAVTALGNGRFSASTAQRWTAGRVVHVRLVGAVRETRASGRMEVTVVATDGRELCGVTSEPWRAVRRPGRIFGGTLPGTGTVVITRLGSDDLRFHTSVVVADCTGTSLIVPSIVIQNGFNVHRRHFTRQVDDDLTLIRTRVSYLITGVIGREHAQGAFSGHLEGYDAMGAVTWSCRVPLRHWSAASA